jgi:hypothetical protein
MRPLIVGVVAALLCATTLQKPRLVVREAELHPLLLQPGLARTMSKSQLPLLIDLYWLRVLNAIGEEDSESKNRALYYYGELLTDLDPRFYQAYLYIALNVPYLVERGVYVNGHLAEKLLRKGLKQYPDDMRMSIVLGYVLFSMERKFLEAAQHYRHLATVPGAPPWVAPLSTRLFAQGGKPLEGLDFVEELLENVDDPMLRQEFEQRREQLLLEAFLQRVDAAVAQFKESRGRLPADVGELVREGFYSGALEDDAGRPVFLRPDGRAATSHERRLEIYE